MKVNGLLGKKPRCARAAWRTQRKKRDATRIKIGDVWVMFSYRHIVRWHRAAKGRK